MRQIEAAQRRAEKEERYQVAVAEAEADEVDRRDLVNSWRDFAPALTKTDYEQTCIERPFLPEGGIPRVPNESHDAEEFNQSMIKKAKEEAAKKSKYVFWFAVLGIIVAFLVPDGVPVSRPILFFGTLVGGVVAVVLVRQMKAGEQAKVMFNDGWSKHLAGLRLAREEYECALAEWPERERSRIEWARRLLAGDREALEETVSASLEDLDFPFETLCRVELPDANAAYVLVDLPEIEDVIPEVKQRALKNGDVKEVRRTKAERNQDYVVLVTGLALWIVRTTFAAGPTLNAVHLAAYTQRRKRGSGRITDDFVYEVEFTRSDAASWDQKDVDPVAAITKPQNRLDLRDNGELKAIAPPTWAVDVLAETA